MTQRQAKPLKGILAGALAGLVGGFVMNQFQNLWSKLSEDPTRSEHAHPPRQHVAPHNVQGEKQSQKEEEPATVQAADAISRELFDHKLTKDERRIAGPVMHYSFAVNTGMMYGALAELTPAATVGFGMPFGAAVWAIADETMVPLFGLSKPPAEYPLSNHLYSLTSHLVYGASTEAARRLTRRLL